jgi:hypothetical protein
VTIIVRVIQKATLRFAFENDKKNLTDINTTFTKSYFMTKTVQKKNKNIRHKSVEE